MRRIVGGICLCLVATLLFASVVLAAEGDNQPNIVIEEMRHHLGKVYEAKKYTHVFTVKNTGTAALKIESVKPG